MACPPEIVLPVETMKSVKITLVVTSISQIVTDEISISMAFIPNSQGVTLRRVPLSFALKIH